MHSCGTCLQLAHVALLYLSLLLCSRSSPDMAKLVYVVCVTSCDRIRSNYHCTAALL